MSGKERKKWGGTIYYTDELKDEFSGISRSTVTVDGDYRYEHGKLWHGASWLLYRGIMTPIAWLYMKIRFSMRVVGREKLKLHRKEGYFLYGNHTLAPGDGFIPSCLTFPKKDVVLVHPDNVSLFGTKNFMEMIGALPLPNHISGMENFLRAVEDRVSKGCSLVIYPEAHIWPYYTKIRPFTAVSFRYPAMYGCPVYCFTVTYQRRSGRNRRPSVTVYIDGPFYPEKGKHPRENAAQLRDSVYHAMTMRSENSCYEYIHYEKRK